MLQVPKVVSRPMPLHFNKRAKALLQAKHFSQIHDMSFDARAIPVGMVKAYGIRRRHWQSASLRVVHSLEPPNPALRLLL